MFDFHFSKFLVTMLIILLSDTHFDAFAAVKLSQVNTEGKLYQRVKFDETVFKAYSFNISIFTANTDGYFFFHFSAGYPLHRDSLSIILAMDDDVNLLELTTNVSYAKFPFSASHITWLTRNQTVCIKSKVDPYSDKLSQTLFLGFRLDHYTMDSFVTLQLLLFHNNGFIHIVQNLSFGMHWDSKNNSVQFSFPTGGIYLTNLCIKFVGWGGVIKKQLLPWNNTVTLFETSVS